MSRLAFDDILKPSSPLGPGAAVKNQPSRKAEETSSFDDTFKQAVDELQPRENQDAEEEPVLVAQNTRESDRPSEKENTEKTTSDPEKTTPPENDSNDSGNPESAIVIETAPPPSNQDDPDDALIATVMAAAQQQEKAMATEAAGEATADDMVSGVEENQDANLLENATFDSDKNLPDPATLTPQVAAPDTDETAKKTTEPLAEPSSEEPNGLTEKSESSTAGAVANATSEVLVPEETASDVQTTSVSTTQMQSEAATANTETTQDPTSGQSETNQDQGSHSEGDGNARQEVTLPQGSQTPMAGAAPGQGEEPVVDSADTKKETTDVAVKTEPFMDRATSLTAETRSGPSHETSTNSTQPTTETTLDTADRVRFVERVAQAFQAQMGDNRAVRMRLHPEELGEIKLEVTVRNGMMHAKIETETREARNILMDNLPALRERLASHDIKIEQFDIDYNAGGDQQGTPHQPDDWTDPGRNGSNRSPNAPNTTTTDTQTETPTPRAVSPTGSGEQLDVTA